MLARNQNSKQIAKEYMNYNDENVGWTRSQSVGLFCGYVLLDQRSFTKNVTLMFDSKQSLSLDSTTWYKKDQGNALITK